MPTTVRELQRRTVCRICKSADLEVFLDFGNVPLAGGFLLESELANEKLYPLDVAVCLNCSLVQVLNTVAADVLFNDYRYLSSVTDTLSQHFRDYAKLLVETILPSRDPFVVEIGCNDGVLLDPLRRWGVCAVGVDPATNVVEVARRRGLNVVNDYFTTESAKRVAAEYGQADVITASNVFAHIDDLHDVMRAVDLLLTPEPEGRFIVEVHYIIDLLQTFQFDTIYHEHLCYYSLHALQRLFQQFDFELVDAERLPMHGGAIRVFASRNSALTKPSDRLASLIEEERLMGIEKRRVYDDFGMRVRDHRNELIRFLLDRKLTQGRSLSGYGAAGRATILLNVCGIDRTLMDYMVDASPFRVGRYVPGVKIPIVAPDVLSSEPTQDCLITAWNYREEIIAKEHRYLENGGKFILPLPRIQILPS